MDALVEAPQILVFVPEGIFRVTAPFLDASGELDHLINGLFAVQAHDVIQEELVLLLLGFPRDSGEHFRKQRDHDFGPALPDEGEGTVKIKEHMRDLGSGSEAGGELDVTGKAVDKRHGRV